MKRLNNKIAIALLTLISTTLVFAIGANLRTIYTEVITTKKANQDITITPSGTGDVILKNYSGVLRASSGTVSTGTVDLTSEVNGILPINNGGTGSSSQNFVDLTSAQSVGGIKTFTDNALFTSVGHIQIPSGTTAQRDGSPANGMFRYNTDTNSFEGYAGGNWGAIAGSGGAGGINYIDNSDFESGTTGYTGDTNLVISQETSAPLRGVGSLEIAKAAADASGEKVYVDFTIDSADLSSKLYISFDYDLSDANYLDDYAKIKITKNPTGTPVSITVYGEDLKGGKGNHLAWFQADATETDYRLAIEYVDTNTDAQNLFVDNVKVGPRELSYGAFISDWKDESLTLSGLAGSTEFKSQRMGDSLNLSGAIDITSASSTLELSLDNYSADLTKVGQDANSNSTIGVAQLVDASTGTRYSGTVFLNSSGGIRFAGDGAAVWSSTVPITIASGDQLSFIATIPIQGFSSNSIQSEDLGQREIIVDAYGNGGTSLTAGVTNIDFDTEIKDSAAAWNGTEFEAKETANYGFKGMVRLTSAVSTLLEVYVDTGSGYALKRRISPTLNVARHSFNFDLELNKGDKVVIRIETNSTLNDVGTDHYITITKYANPQTIFSDHALYQTKYLSSDQTTDGTMSDLTFSNLTIGKCYKIDGGQANFGALASNDTVRIDFKHNSNTIHTVAVTGVGSVGASANIPFNSAPFTATATTLTVEAASITSTSEIRGNNSKAETHVTLRECKMVEYTGW